MSKTTKSKEDYIKKLPQLFQTYSLHENSVFEGYKKMVLTLLQLPPNKLKKIVGSPENLCRMLGHNIRHIKEIRRIDGAFVYDKEIFKNIEDASKKYYRNLGYRCYYTEGFDLPLVNDACISVILNKIRGNLKIGKKFKDQEKYIRSLECESRLEGFQATGEQYRRFLDCGSPRSALLDSSFLQCILNKQWDSISLGNYFDIKVPESDLRKIIKKTILEIDNEISKENETFINEIEFCINSQLSEPIDEYSSDGQKKSYWKELQEKESGISALDIIKTIGFKKCAELSIKNELRRQIYFDLTVIDVKNKKIIKSEIKNSDFFTKHQIFSLSNFSLRRSGIFEFELCIARPENS